MPQHAFLLIGGLGFFDILRPVLSRPRIPALRHLAAAALLSASALAQAAPVGDPPPADPVTRFLGDRGLVQQVRDRASDLVMSAMNFIGVPYRRGGNSGEDGFDCSGFTRYVFDHSLGLVLPRRAEEQARAPGLFSVPREELKPGDLVFFNTLKRTFSHVGIYVGEGKFIHAPRTGAEVRIEDMRDSYWAKRFTGARRAPGAADAAALLAPVAGAEAATEPARSSLTLRSPRPD